MDEYLSKLRHSAEHVLTQTMQELGYKFLMAMGPATDDGFYFDFELLDGKISEEDFEKIEKKMQEIIDRDLPFVKEEVSIEKAREVFKDNPYKQEWLDEIEKAGEKKATLYWTGEPNDKSSFVDLCKGPHVERTSEIKSFKLLSIAGAYWRGNEKNKMLTRIYGTAFVSKKELKEYLHMLEEAKKRSHIKIGKEMGIYAIFPEIGQGLPVWLQNGYLMRKAVEDVLYELDTKHNFEYILSPHIYKSEVFKISGHLQFYKDSMYRPMKIDGREFYLKPMNCPAAILVYNMRGRSYRELPMKIAEFGTVYRYEKSGELHGLQRVRGFTQNDAHVVCTPDQLESVLMELFDMMLEFYKAIGFDKSFYKLRLSLSDSQKDKYKVCGARKEWEEAEDILRRFVKKANKYGIESYEAKGEAAFYGPKLDVQAINVYGKEDSISTIQIDFNLPQRFNMRYVDKDGNKKRPYVIHRAFVGSYERFFAFLIEYYAGKFPVWFAPIQAKVIPISEKVVDYGNKVMQELLKLNHRFRLRIDNSDETLNKKIRKAQLERVPYMLVVGEREKENNTVSVRLRNGKNLGEMKVDEFGKYLQDKIEQKSLEL